MTNAAPSPGPATPALAVPEARWPVGQVLRVLPIRRPGHSRVPGFLEGRLGTVLRDWGDFPNPEALARGEGSAPPVPVYLLAFEPTTLWPDAPVRHGDRVLVDVYGPNLAPG
jgi:nitrile hydratase subunit beta